MLLVTTKLKVLASLQTKLSSGLASNTFQTQNNLFGSLGLFMENWLSLTTVTSLFTVVSSLTLSEKGSLTSLILGNLVLSVLSAGLTLAISLSGFWNVHFMLDLTVLPCLYLPIMRSWVLPVLFTREYAGSAVINDTRKSATV